MTLLVQIDKSTAAQLEEIRHRAMLAKPIITMQRAISHIGKQPGLPTGDAIQVLIKACNRMRGSK